MHHLSMFSFAVARRVANDLQHVCLRLLSVSSPVMHLLSNLFVLRLYGTTQKEALVDDVLFERGWRLPT